MLKKYKVLYVEVVEGKSVWVEKNVKSLTLNDNEIVAVVDEDNISRILNDTTFVREFTGMFDKNAFALYSDDIIKFSYGEKEYLLAIAWINGGYCIAIEDEEMLVYFTQQNVREVEWVGNVFQHGSILEGEVDETIFQPKEGESAE